MSKQQHFTFKRYHRLLKSAEFSTVFQKKRFKVTAPSFILLARLNQNLQPRLGMVIGKKKVKHAWARQQIKRVFRESFRHQQHNLPNIDIVVIAKQGLGELDKADLRETIDRKWQELNKQAAN